MNGLTELAVYESFEDISGRKSTLQELIKDVSSYTQQSVLWVCAAIVVGVQLWNKIELQPQNIYEQLLSLFFGGKLRARLIAGYWATQPRRVLFHRRQVLLIAKLAILHCSGKGIDARSNPRSFGPILLKANDQLHYDLLANLPGGRVSSRDDFAKIIAEMVAVSEHAFSNVGGLITRGHLMLTRFAEQLCEDSDFVDIAGEHQRRTGLSLEEFEALIFAVPSRFGKHLADKLFTEPGTLPLKDENFGTTSVSPEKVRSFLDSLAASPGRMATELDRRDTGPNDLTVFRKFPLVQQFYNLHLKTAWCGFLMLDNLFFLEKIQAGPYWAANEVHPLRLRKFWGAVFEGYVNELMRQACSSTRSLFIPDPRPLNNPDVQICDGILVSGDSIVLMEYKSSMFRADTKYSGDPTLLGNEIEKKLVQDREAGQRKGVWQLAQAVKILFGGDARKSVQGIDLKSIKHVYLYLITLDSIGSTVGISPFLNTFLDGHLDRQAFPSVNIRPLFCSDIEALETLTGFFRRYALSDILEEWFATNPSLATPVLLLDLRRFVWTENAWLIGEWNEIFKRMVVVLFPDKDPDVALSDARKMASRS